MMRKLLFMLCVGLVVVGLCVGCGSGSDTKQAKEYMQQGDTKANLINNEYAKQLPTYMRTPFDFKADPAKFEMEAGKSLAFFDKINETADEAIASYKKISTLDGAPDYVAYADLRIKDMGYLKQGADAMAKYMSEAIGFIKAGDATGLSDAAAQLETDMKKIADKQSETADEIKKLRSDKNL
jgi:hypothetical protein